MEGKVRRRPNFSDEELKSLIEAVSCRNSVLLGKLDNINTAKKKQCMWQQVVDAVNIVSLHRRNIGEVRKKFSDFKAIVKKKVSSEKLHSTGTGK